MRRGWGERQRVPVGEKEREQRRKKERSEESGLTDVFIIHHLIPLIFTATPSSLED